MDTNRMKKAAEWYCTKVFRGEAIRPPAPHPQAQLPSLLRAARSLESTSGRTWQSRESIFLNQAKLLAAYEDDYAFQGSVTRYFPTYQSLTDEELRGYFAWRTRLRRGQVEKTSLSFVFLYIYELINQVGVEDPLDGYRKLTAFRDAYAPLDGSILSYLSRWLTDYAVYYQLSRELLEDTPQLCFYRCLSVLDDLEHQPQEAVISALTLLAPKWLERSRFYGEYKADCDAVILRVLRQVSRYYSKKCKFGFVEQYFGVLREYQVRLFDAAVFCDPLRVREAEYALDPRCVYRCHGGLWTVRKHAAPLKPNPKLGDLLKTIDAVMRQEYGYRHPIRQETETKWLVTLIREEAAAYMAEKKAAEARKITIDTTRLERIRRDAAVTRDKLMVDEELFLPEPEPAGEIPAEPPEPLEELPLPGPEYRLLQCLLYGGSLSWIQAEDRILSVLADSANELLFDTFQDAVLLLEEPPSLVEDYIEDLKEMIHP